MSYKLKVLFNIITLALMTGYLYLNILTPSVGSKKVKLNESDQLSAIRVTGQPVTKNRVLPTMNPSLGRRLAPAFQLDSLQSRKKISLDQYKGKNTLLVAWTSWCAECHKELQLLESNPPKHVSIILVNLTKSESSLNQVKQFVQNEGLSFPVALDKNGSFQNAYHIHVIPTSILVGPTGNILHMFYGPTQEKDLEKWIPNRN